MSAFSVYNFDDDYDSEASTRPASDGEAAENDESDNDFSDGDNNGRSRLRRGKAKIWTKQDQLTFQNSEEASRFLEQESCWSVCRTNVTSVGKSVYYRCKYKTQGSRSFCPAEMYLQHNSTDGSVFVFRSDCDHDHKDRSPVSRGLSHEQKDWIRNNFDLGLRMPTQIIQGMLKAGLPEPEKMQLKNFLASFKAGKFGKSKTISIADIKAWCSLRSVWNENLDIDTAFVSGFESGVLANQEPFFRFFVTSRRLLRITAKSSIIHVDGTYKNVWEGFPVLVAGVTDRNRSFHPAGMAVCAHETTDDYSFIYHQVKTFVEKEAAIVDESFTFNPKVAMADAAESITNAAAIVWEPDIKRAYCWAHVVMQMDRQLNRITDKQLRQSVRTDIFRLQLASNASEFDSAAAVLQDKWRQRNEVADFLSYFVEQWITKHSAWFEGFAIGYPSTNNALESCNRQIKQNGTFHERLPLQRFLVTVESIVANWSKDRSANSVNCKIYHDKPDISSQLYQDARSWLSEKKTVLSRSVGEKLELYFSASGYDDLTVEKLEEFTSICSAGDWNSFDDYAAYAHSVWCVSFNVNDWISSNCTCPSYAKFFICKHIIGMAVKKRVLKLPEFLEQMPLGQKMKRGRPAKAKKALLLQQ